MVDALVCSLCCDAIFVLFCFSDADGRLDQVWGLGPRGKSGGRKMKRSMKEE